MFSRIKEGSLEMVAVVIFIITFMFNKMFSVILTGNFLEKLQILLIFVCILIGIYYYKRFPNSDFSKYVFKYRDRLSIIAVILISLFVGNLLPVILMMLDAMIYFYKKYFRSSVQGHQGHKVKVETIRNDGSDEANRVMNLLPNKVSKYKAVKILLKDIQKNFDDENQKSKLNLFLDMCSKADISASEYNENNAIVFIDMCPYIVDLKTYQINYKKD